VAEEWERGQSIIQETKKTEKDKLTKAIQRYKKPDTSLEE
jgi:hypothetical protein